MKRLASSAAVVVSLAAVGAAPAAADQPDFTPGCFGGFVSDFAHDGGLALGQDPKLERMLVAIRRHCKREHQEAIAEHRPEHP